jgi:cytidine kinase
MSLLVVGTVAFDSIETPHGTADYVLGGSATFSSFAASYFTKPHLVAVVGEDFPEENRKLIADRGVDLAGLETVKGGKTFYWKGRYHANMNDRDTIEVDLNVLNVFDPVLPDAYRDCTHIFLANSNPAVQAKVLDQIRKPTLVLADTMDFWITTQHADLLKLLPRIDGLLINDSEAKLLTGEDNLVKAGRKVRSMGPKFVVVKKGEHGAMLVAADGEYVLPAYPTPEVLDPTGAGDSFAGGTLGYLSTAADAHEPGSLRRGLAYGTVIASLTVEGFGTDRIKAASRDEVERRLERYRAMMAF